MIDSWKTAITVILCTIAMATCTAIISPAHAHSAGSGDHYATPEPEDRAPTEEEAQRK
jgi:hypothetical protein